MSCDEHPTNRKMDDLVKNISLNIGRDSKGSRYETSPILNLMQFSDVRFLKIDYPVNRKDEPINGRNSASEKDLDYDRVHLVVKKPVENKKIRKRMYADRHFSNEILFYREFAKCDVDPKGKEPRYARCYYIEERPPYDSSLTLEDVSAQGYNLCGQEFNVDRCYVNAAIREIARFHAFGYAMKERDPNKFFALIDNIVEVRYRIENESTRAEEFGEFFLTAPDVLSTKATEYLKSVCAKEELSYWENVETLLKNAYENVVKKALLPQEPMATLCHGDFTISNVLFKKEEQTTLRSDQSEEKKGNLKALLIDFSMIRYTTPMWDLSTFFFLSCQDAILRGELADLLATYHVELTRCLIEEYNVPQLVLRFTSDALRYEFQRSGLLGLVFASCHLSTIMGKINVNSHIITDMNALQVVKLIIEGIDDELSAILGNMLLQLKDFGCLRL